MKESLREKQSRLTRETICQSLLELMETQPVEKIKVSDICRRAGVSRGTFYNHFVDIEDLTDSVISWFADMLSSQVSRFFDRESLSETEQRAILRAMLDAILEQRRYCRVILCGPVGDEAARRAFRTIIERYESWLRRYHPERDRAQATYLLTASLSGGLAVLRRWMQGGFKEEPEELFEYIIKLRNIH